MLVADSEVLLRVNQILGTIPLQGTYELSLMVGAQSFRITSRPRGKLVVSFSSAEDPGAQTIVTVDSWETLQKLGTGGQSLALRLVAQRKLNISGDMAKLQDLRREVEPHAEAFKVLMQGAVPWLPDSTVEQCMNFRCAKTFSIFRRRHHCRGCGEIFCRFCAPKTNALGSRQRTCINCIARTHSTTTTEVSTSSSSMPKAADHTYVESQAALLYELQVEQAIYHINLLCFALTCCGFLLLIRLHSRMWSLIATFPYTCLVAVFFLALCRKTLLRSLRIMKISVIVAINVVLGYIQTYRRSDAASDAIWSLTHRINARIIFDATVSLSGFWVKIAQICSVSVALPEAYSIELSKLQDSVPPCSLEHVMRTLAEDFGPQWENRIILHDGPPLGCATIAQVHRAKIRPRLESDFIEGVIKVQHPGIEETLHLDMYAAGLIANALKLLNSKMFRDFPAIFRDIAELTLTELDFRTEAENQKMARLALRETSLPVMVPEVFEDLVSSRALAMEFVNGEKITDYVKNGGNAQLIVQTVCEYFATSVLGPIFNTDPHPGNLFVEHGSGRLCVLDWGQARRQSLSERNGMAQLWLAAALSSPSAFIDACQELGYKFNKRGKDYFAAFFALGGFRWNSRETKSLKDTRADTAFFLKFVQGMPQELAEFSARAGAFWKGPLLSFTKSLDILFNVSTSLNVSVSCLTICANYSYRYLLNQRRYQILPAVASDTFFLLPSQVTCSSSSPICTLDSELREILQRHHSQGSILGAQLVVLDAQNSQTICKACIGHTSWMDPKPVTQTTLFDIGELSKIVLAFIAMKHVESKAISLDHPLSSVWPAAKHLKDVTLEQILAHTAGMFQVYPKCAETIADAENTEKMISSIVGEAPLMANGEVQIYHHACFGLLLSNIMKYLGGSLEQNWTEFCISALGSNSATSLCLSCEQAVSIAPLQAHMRSYSVEELAEDFAGLQDLMDADKARSKPDGTTAKAQAMAILSTIGRETWPIDAALPLPGCQAFSTADTMAKLLLKVHQGGIVENSTLQNMTRSRKPAGHSGIKLPVVFSAFNDAEFGLGLQLLRQPQNGSCTTRGVQERLAWGHSSLTGSFAFVVPGRRHLVASLVVNRFGGNLAAEEILACLWRHAGK